MFISLSVVDECEEEPLSLTVRRQFQPPEIVQVTRPIPAQIKKKIMLRLVEAVFSTNRPGGGGGVLNEMNEAASIVKHEFDPGHKVNFKRGRPGQLRPFYS